MSKKLKEWCFGVDNEKLVKLVLEGKKTATTSIYNGDVDDIGTESILVYNNGKHACITKTLNNIVCKFKDVDWNIAKLEGENDNLEDWRKSHIEFFKSIDSTFSEEREVVVEIFEVINK